MSLADVVWTYSGVRPLYDDPRERAKAATRDYVLEVDAAGGAPLVSVFGGKITTFRASPRNAPATGAGSASARRPGAGRVRGAARRRFPSADFAISCDLGQSYPFLAGAIFRGSGTPMAPGLVACWATRAMGQISGFPLGTMTEAGDRLSRG